MLSATWTLAAEDEEDCLNQVDEKNEDSHATIMEFGIVGLLNERVKRRRDTVVMSLKERDPSRDGRNPNGGKQVVVMLDITRAWEDDWRTCPDLGGWVFVDVAEVPPNG